MCANKKLLTCRARRRGLVLPWRDLEGGLDDIPTPRRSGTLPSGSLADEEIRRHARKMQRASTVHHLPSVESMFGRTASHIELYDEEIEYKSPTDPQAADEMEAEAWTDPEDLEQGGSDAPDDGEDARGRRGESSEHYVVTVVQSSSKDDSDDSDEDKGAAHDEDSDDDYLVRGEDTDPTERHGLDGGDCAGPTGGASLLTPAPGAAGGHVSGGQGCGLDVPQGSIFFGIFKEDFDVGGPPTSEARQGGVRTRTQVSDVAHHIGLVFAGASSGMLEEVVGATGKRDKGRCGDDVDHRPLWSVRDIARRLDMDLEDVLEEEWLRPMVAGCATTQRLALAQDTTRAREIGCTREEVTASLQPDSQQSVHRPHGGHARAGDGGGVGTRSMAGLLGCHRTKERRVDRVLVEVVMVEDVVADSTEEVVADHAEDVVADHTEDGNVTVDDVVAERNEEERLVDGVVVTAPVEAPMPSMSPLELHSVGIDPLMGSSRHISERI
ncbi:hypothetical protein CBR_g12831 [Chara braunii]|uniref:Uncharacterized protein n=1 Tax=Chara braunii TaxID=69332 RepID=A0A388KSS5_CHABU|nr:hypothetical protein CBR_g12831 [Chara braunii]|eukprot:GBG73114.1 hypothetical protein CBR_g12831 [Chara braunii]